MNRFVVANLKPVLSGRKILLGISGSIAAFKAHDLVRYFKDCGAQVRCVLTENAREFVTPLTLETLSQQPVLSSIWTTPSSSSSGMSHIDLARWADIAVIAPATANTIAKLALGLADDLLSTELLAFRGPVFVAPAMNPAMFEHPATIANLKTLESRGVKILGPAKGMTACGDLGSGRMLEPHEIVESVAESFCSKPNGKSALITLGPTRSSLDPVRFLTNRSSGKMGASLCWAAHQRGYKVTAICGPTDVALPSAIEVFRVNTANEMAKAVYSRFSSCDLFISAAAVLDWEFDSESSDKIKKSSSSKNITLKPTTDILASVGALKKPHQFILGFAAETSSLLKNARSKLKSKNCDAIFVNKIESSPTAATGFDSDTNAGFLLTPSGPKELSLATKPELARTILDQVSSKNKKSFPIRKLNRTQPATYANH